jgi:arginine/lysine/ornithine decarboxylase
LTQSTILADNQGSEVCRQELLAAVKRHLAGEKASFHTPGHKGRLALDIGASPLAADLTELPGLDELACAGGVLQALQARIASVAGARASFISVNGASAAITAAVLACARRGSEILLPRNVHRSALNALIFTGLEPVWYEAEWLSDWGTWAEVEIASFEQQLNERAGSLAAALVTSPVYAGLVSDIEKISWLCRKNNVVLIVDEAHGAHLCAGGNPGGNALAQGADFVAHSLHKTLSAPTQTGVLHVGRNCPLEDVVARAALNTLQSSSPSYLFMLGIEKALLELEQGVLKKALNLARDLRARLAGYEDLLLLNRRETLSDPLHLLIAHRSLSGNEFYRALSAKGIYAETVLGNGVLLLIGLGSQESDLEQLLSALASISPGRPSIERTISRPPRAPQHLNPRRAFFADSCLIQSELAAGYIACDWIAPCPPGTPVLAPGQRITPEIIQVLEPNTSIRVVKHPQLEGDSDGSNTAC